MLEIKQLIHPHSVASIKMDGEIIEDTTVKNVSAYFVMYFLILFAAFLIISLDNMDFASTFSAVVTCLNNVGPGFNIVGPVGNFATLSNLSKIVLSFVMLVGRLELFPFMVLISRK